MYEKRRYFRLGMNYCSNGIKTMYQYKKTLVGNDINII